MNMKDTLERHGSERPSPFDIAVVPAKRQLRS